MTIREWGYFPVRCGSRGRLQWHYHTNPSGTCDPHNHLTSSVSGLTMGPDGPIPNVDWEMVREGVDDARLIATLRRLLAEAEAKGLPERDRTDAEADLAWLLSSIQPDLDYYVNEAGYWDASTYDKLKWMLGRHCVALQAAIDRGA